MSLLEVSGLSMSFADKNLYEDASFQLEKGEHLGIVGQNGAGKSTLIKILTGTVLPVEGSIKWQKNIRIGYLDQYADIPDGMTLIQFLHTAYADLYAMDEQMQKYYADYAESMDDKLLEKAGRIQDELAARNFYEVETEIERVISGLGLNEIGKDHVVSEMSGGQRSKIILAKLLLENPDVILLDEPTNYLDVSHIQWLEDYLNGFEGAAMVISHDYDFLEAVTNAICDVSFGQITKYRGSFKKAMKQKEEKREAQEKAYEKQRVVIEKNEKLISKFKAGSHSNLAKSREKMLKHMDRIDPPSDALQARFDFPYLDTGSQNALVVRKISVGYEHPLLAPVTFTLGTGQKIAFAGFNGVGKSTLIKSILGQLKPLSGEAEFSPSAKVNYFSQDLVWDDDSKTPLQIIQDEFPTMLPKTIRTKLGAAGINAANVMKPMNLLSGGEQTKVKLAVMELTPSNFLIMDEPTNHLDDETKHALADALNKFRGNLIMVSHEEGFYDDWIDEVLNVEKLSLRKSDK
ncbi:MAG: ATP-binding cassette domain-containing protein [Furfurilactobacillus sp.]|jgi:ATPase subunit of ABC transporter with duplicated ATPase domains|uniref:ATP-binding cassette domain-containing protein n=1 Tax=Furfurilactobacillus milii TaxID=2888272 RepID=A0A6N9I5M0_9LACO|nr:MULTISPECIES: ABC-F family ATP-binding cassette domain-containing protein [Furfurilactobacillus]QLE67299.1 ABC-F ATP-binding cassette -containing protein [Furfurilactobacillus rossiae]MCF6161011.1 ATP-binding cassette domain-containing protein [Furfurilactobacillus milii]MCF6163499.1 ATP-binding cassette domain-containing protein [Furfurilactobacillus milii]MCF6418700.1 ATP-binding cassette domain-containing protein [Furfurilactobacillus milii]MCH4011489.1 ATP-binding cassette domain-contai